MDDLWRHAEDETWRRFEKLEEEKKLSPLAAQDLKMLRDARQTDPEFSLRADDYKELAFYYFDERFDTPYRRLCVNRFPEDGQRVMMGDGNECSFNWTLEKDLVYLEFAGELENCCEIKLDNSWLVNRAAARRIAKDPRFKALIKPDVAKCLEDILNYRNGLKDVDAARAFCIRLLGAKEQYCLRINDEAFLDATNEKLKLRGGTSKLEKLVQFVDMLAKEIGYKEFGPDTSWHATMKKMIAGHFRPRANAVYRVLQESISLADYIRMKLKLATEVGIA